MSNPFFANTESMPKLTVNDWEKSQGFEEPYETLECVMSFGDRLPLKGEVVEICGHTSIAGKWAFMEMNLKTGVMKFVRMRPRTQSPIDRIIALEQAIRDLLPLTEQTAEQSDGYPVAICGGCGSNQGHKAGCKVDTAEKLIGGTCPTCKRSKSDPDGRACSNPFHL
jgi:hypothetical protein